MLFDEMSSEAVGPLVSDLQRMSGHVHSQNITTTGKDSVNVIPSMLTAKNFDTSEPGGVATLCSSHWSLDMTRLHARSDELDVIGFHMPYCHIGNLRSCSMISWGRFNRAQLENSLVCGLFSEFNCLAALTRLKTWL